MSNRVAACDKSVSEISGGKDLEVSIADRNRPLEGINVQISKTVENPDIHTEIVASGVSDATGRVTFTHLNKGRYIIATEHLGVEGSATYLIVKPKKPTTRIALEWPAQDILKVRDIAGTFTARFFRDTERGMALDMAYKQEGPFSNERISLTRAYSGQNVGTTTTDEHGRFNFGAVSPGLYILHVKETTAPKSRHDMDIEGDIFIEISATANDQHLPALQLNESSCGLSYSRF